MPILELTDPHIEFLWFAAANSSGRHPVILLHEGLGSVSLWKTCPQEVADATGRAVLAYSRHGYGQSSALNAAREARFMHDEALVTLPLLRERLGLGACVLPGVQVRGNPRCSANWREAPDQRATQGGRSDPRR